ncbi:MAG TPA: LacI family transcriptional regulator [Candidatus Ruania gallistercoris]|uniref:LacI family transcriptional regulator n=1 Tax=Candidatus Ruania gallistercoris TaxID=2838746 RepID=A0A9D2EHF7_9MICO|nr:LacI family transcriptional regulator [Candidatus Ruania gallistercoris]
MKRPASTLTKARAPKLASVAKAAQVSIGLASRVLNHDPTVSVRDETRQRVEAAAERLHYVPSASARALRQQRTNVIGLAVHDLASTIVVDLLEGAREQATSHDYLLLLTDADEIAFHESSRRLYLGGARIDGLIMQDGHADLGAAIDEIAGTLPTVVFNTPGRSLSPGVQVDERSAGRIAAECLIEAGHRQIGFIGGPAGTYTNSARLEGAAAAVAEVGGTMETFYGDWSAPSGFASMENLLRSAPGTTGVVTANVLIGTGAMAAAQASGRQVPQNLSVVAVQDSWAVEFTTPRLTTVALPLRELGRCAVRTLIAYIDGEDVQDSETVGAAPQIRPRESVAAPAAHIESN